MPAGRSPGRGTSGRSLAGHRSHGPERASLGRTEAAGDANELKEARRRSRRTHARAAVAPVVDADAGCRGSHGAPP